MKKMFPKTLFIAMFLAVLLYGNVLPQNHPKMTAEVLKTEEKFAAEIPDINSVIPVDSKPVPLKVVRPIYPDFALKVGIEGNVLVKVLIDKTGTPENAVAIKSDGEIFEKPALQAALKTIFRPAMKDGEKIRYWTTIRYAFIRYSDNMKSL